MTFPTRNKLFAHLREQLHFSKSPKRKRFPHEREVNFRPLYRGSAYLAHAGAFLESVCSNKTTSVLYHNKSDRPVIMTRNTAIGDMTEFDDRTECVHIEADQIDKDLKASFKAAERHPMMQFEAPTAVTGFCLGREVKSRNTEGLMVDAMAESLFDDIGPPEITSSIDDIKYGPRLTPEQLQQLKDLVARHRTIWEKWSRFLGDAEAIINTSTTAATKMSPNEVLYGFKLRSGIGALAQGLAPQDTESFSVLRALARGR